RLHCLRLCQFRTDEPSASSVLRGVGGVPWEVSSGALCHGCHQRPRPETPLPPHPGKAAMERTAETTCPSRGLHLRRPGGLRCRPGPGGSEFLDKGIAMRFHYLVPLLLLVGLAWGGAPAQEKDEKNGPGPRPDANVVEIRFADDSTVKMVL